MNRNKSVLYSGGFIIGLAVLLRIILSCVWGDTWGLFVRPEPESYRAVTIVDREAEVSHNSLPSESVETEEASPPELDPAVVQIKYSCSRQPDIEALLKRSLSWNLTGDDPAVLIVHTHGTEAFTPELGAEYEEIGGKYRTTDDEANVISLGDELIRLLQAAGIHAIHDRNYYDLDYEKAYSQSREAVQAHLKNNPSIRLVIDLHRDAITGEDGSQIATSAMVCGEKSARVMLVVGTDSRSAHPDWEENLSLALKLHAAMETAHPGVTRPLDLRKQRFNQDLSTGAILAEIGTAGNTHEEAMKGVSVLAEAIILLANGTD